MTHHRIALRVRYRVPVRDHWTGVLTSSTPLVVESSRDRFMLEALCDPGPVDCYDYEPDAIFRAYLFDDVSAAVFQVLEGRDDADETIEDSDDGPEVYCEEYIAYLREAAARINRLSTSALDLLLWRGRIRAGPADLNADPFRLHWVRLTPQDRGSSVHDLGWCQVPFGEMALHLPDMDALDLRTEVAADLSGLLDAHIRAPLGQVLMREAWRNRESNLRSALVMAVAAVETGAKEFVARAAPDAAWLVENLQSPPLHKILADYLPTLPSRCGQADFVPPIPESWRMVLKRGVEDRNKVVHGRDIELDADMIERLLATSLDLLYFLDYHSGYGWAQAGDAE